MRLLLLSYAACLLAIAGCTEQSDDAGVPENVNYNWHVRPILSENCFQCHGPDEEALEAGLRLDRPDLAMQRLEGPRERYAIVPGDPDSSELVWRINTSSADDQMPPASTHKTLTEREKQILRQWITDGAEYQRHWAYVAPESVTVSETEFDDRVENGGVFGIGAIARHIGKVAAGLAVESKDLDIVETGRRHVRLAIDHA